MGLGFWCCALIAHFSGIHLEVQSGDFPGMDFYGIGV